MYQQLTPPNLTVAGQIGYCLHYAGLVFGVTSGPGTAWLAWEATQFKHADQNFPTGVSFPAWFSGAGGAGHVVVVTPEGIYSSPWQTGTTHAVLSSIAQVESIYGVKFVGWSEDIEGKQVVKENDMFTPAQINTLCAIAFNRQAREDEKQTYSSLPIQEVLNRIEGGDENKSLRSDAQSFRDGAGVKYAPYTGPELFTEQK